MKKFTFILAALFAATFVNAQITLEHTFDGKTYLVTPISQPWSSGPIVHSPYYGNQYDGSMESPYFYTYSSFTWTNGHFQLDLKLSDIKTFALYKSTSYSFPGDIGDIDPHAVVFYVTKNIFTTDGKVAFICYHRYPNFVRVIDEDGNVVFDFNKPSLNEFTLIKTGDSYKLLALEIDDNLGTEKTYVYSLPGNGDSSTDIVSPSSPKRSARKIARDGQVLVETETSTYTIHGAEVK